MAALKCIQLDYLELAKQRYIHVRYWHRLFFMIKSYCLLCCGFSPETIVHTEHHSEYFSLHYYCTWMFGKKCRRPFEKKLCVQFMFTFDFSCSVISFRIWTKLSINCNDYWWQWNFNNKTIRTRCLDITHRECKTFPLAWKYKLNNDDNSNVDGCS